MNEHTNGREDERKGEKYIPLGINVIVVDDDDDDDEE